jgi:hypothetical protein
MIFQVKTDHVTLLVTATGFCRANEDREDKECYIKEVYLIRDGKYDELVKNYQQYEEAIRKKFFHDLKIMG